MTKNIIAHWVQIHRKLAGELVEPQGGAWAPNTDVYESADDVMVKVELAGVDKESIQIQLDGQTVIIQGMRRDPYGGESTAGYRFRQMEIEYGPFQRAVTLPFPVDAEHATAQMQNGILKIRLPRAHEPTPTRISVVMGE
jgi:HSP20 family protein